MKTSTAQSLVPQRLHVFSAATALLGAALLGAVIVFFVGFSSMSAAHNAAHDMRHANAFPCH
jgi:cobalt transporter subunit CbtB